MRRVNSLTILLAVLFFTATLGFAVNDASAMELQPGCQAEFTTESPEDYDYGTSCDGPGGSEGDPDSYGDGLGYRGGNGTGLPDQLLLSSFIDEDFDPNWVTFIFEFLTLFNGITP